ncbi:hypothetical protein [Streptomyces liliifuscus]|uniref:Uncharacterized protein n=1 Tax=Streptomyces liliifuscus TaxID=2797636 RepID=A0A7T7I0Q1_9ACTN|nr:hypothetical protein [Streptomyces liliifuscus]QQM38879.1 hypothetical protein JEQ17_04920 [Streptomyces liliifuscus]
MKVESGHHEVDRIEGLRPDVVAPWRHQVSPGVTGTRRTGFSPLSPPVPRP